MQDYDFGNFLREQRELRGLSQYQLGALVGVSDKAVSKWENGVSRPQSRILGKLCRALGITVDELLSCELRLFRDEGGAFAMKNDLWNTAYRRMGELFGGNAPALAVDRFESERAELEGTDMIVGFGLLARIADRAREAGTRFRALGHTGAFYTAYLLGAAEIDPLPPHYYCPVCHRTEFVNGISDCWDLPPKKCDCGGEPLRAGHDIPFETYRYVIENHARVGGEVAERFFDEAQQVVKEYFADSGVLKVTRDDRPENATFLILPPEHPRSKDGSITYDEYREIYPGFMSVTLMSSRELELCRKLESETVTSIDRIPYDDADVLDAFSRFDIDGIPQFADGGSGFMKDMLSRVKPKGFSELVQVQGLLHGTGVWDDNVRQVIRGGMEIGHMIAYRDDVYSYMLKKTLEHGITGNGIAYRIMRDAYRGIIAKDGIDDATRKLFSELGVEEWFSEALVKIRYLFPRVHGVVFTKYALIMMWYKLHYPETFRSIIIQ